MISISDIFAHIERMMIIILMIILIVLLIIIQQEKGTDKPGKQNFQNRYNEFVELHTEKLQTKFQVPSI